jgi:serine/threonine-protein kinase
VVTPAQTARLLGSGDKLGKHEVIRPIAIGGAAELYLTRTVGAEGLERLACVKRVLPQYAQDPGFVGVYLSEARLAAGLHHPNIAQVFDVGQDGGEYFFSMEYVHGEDLGRLVTASAEHSVPISIDCALTVAAGLCAGLHHAHEKASPDGRPLGIVHRDVSPTNVVISYDGAVKLVDFGIARAGAGMSPSPGGRKGKVSYLSPEQARGDIGLDRRSDVFSVGTILYQLTTGRLPFIDATEPGVLQQIVERDAAPPSALVAGYPPPLEAIVMRALARNPDQRFATALALQNQLEDFAHEHRLRVSPLVLARLMSTLFPARLEEWDHARAQGAFFVEQHVVRTLIESGKVPDTSPRDIPQRLASVDDTSTALVHQAAPDTELSERTELGPQPWLAQAPPRPAVTRHPSQPSISRPPTQPPVGVPSVAPRTGSATQPPVGVPSVAPRTGSASQPPMGVPSVAPRTGSASQPPMGVPSVVPRTGSASQPPMSAQGPQPPVGAASVAPRTASPSPPPVSGHPTQPPASGHPLQPPASGHPLAPRSGRPSQQQSVLSSSLRASRPSQPPLPGMAPSPRSSPRPPSSPPVSGAAAPPPEAISEPALPAPAASLGALPAATDDPFQTSPSQVVSAKPLTYAPRASLVPNMPGAVPIMMGLSAPPIPSGGTLVSSATQAGNPPPAVRPVPGPFGQGGLDGFAGQGHAMAGGHGMPGAGMSLPGMPPAQPGGRIGGPERPRAAAVPTLMLRTKRSRAPLMVFGVFAVAAIAIGAWLTLGDRAVGDAAVPPAVVRKAEPATEGTTPPAERGAEPASANAAAPEPTADPATPPAHAVQPSGGGQATPSRPGDDDKLDPAKKKPVRAAQPDPRPKPVVKPKLRVEPKRPVKGQPKEQPWNDDSPFMPVATPKR